ncbi:hypothetical protein MY1884_007798 [Beauveria asiatica]
MKFFAVAALSAGALAMPTTEIEARTNAQLCPSDFYRNPVCAALDPAGIVCVDLSSPSENPRDVQNFQEICAKVGKQARCAILTLANQAVPCNRPIGGSN